MKQIKRSKSEVIAFPQVGIQLHVLDIQGNAVRFGLEAPAEMVCEGPAAQPHTLTKTGWLPQPVRHELRNELHAIRVGLDLVLEEVLAGKPQQALVTLAEVHQSLQRVDQHPSLNPGPK